MNVLVCGGAGYIGSNMTAMLMAHGHNPVVYDNLSRGHRAALRHADFVEGDLADGELLLDILREKNIEAVMHFAALIEVAESMNDPLGFYRNNVANTLTLLEAMQAADVTRFVFSSSAAVYGMPDRTPILESAPKNPINAYGQTKLAVERMCRFQAATGRLRYAALRYFNAAGAGADGTIGEDHHPESHLIPRIIFAAMQGGSVSIYGSDYETPDGTCVRDYIHVEDLCSAHLLALDALETEAELTLNLGNGKGYSVREVIETVRHVTGRDFSVVEAPRRPGDPAVLTACADLAIKQLGWQIRHPSLEAIVESAWKWHRSRPNGYGDRPGATR